MRNMRVMRWKMEGDGGWKGKLGLRGSIFFIDESIGIIEASPIKCCSNSNHIPSPSKNESSYHFHHLMTWPNDIFWLVEFPNWCGMLLKPSFVAFNIVLITPDMCLSGSYITIYIIIYLYTSCIFVWKRNRIIFSAIFSTPPMGT